RNSFGEIGGGTVTGTSGPTAVAGGFQWLSVNTARLTTCGVRNTGQGYCWGANQRGEIGSTAIPVPTIAVPAITATSSPHRVAGGLRFSYISVSSGFGDGSNPPLTGPSPGVNGQGGYGFTCALTERGAAFCWGWNVNGSLGDGTTINSAAPVPVAGSNIFTSIYAGGASACAAWLNSIQCWGGNLFGQLGNGTLLNVGTPTLVANPFEIGRASCRERV